MKRITSRQNALVSRYRAVAHGDDRTVMLLDGVHLIADALDADLTMHQAAVTPEGLTVEAVARLVDRLEASGIELISASAAVMAALSPVRSSSPIVALADRPSDGEGRMFEAVTPLIVYAVDVQDPGNVGAIARVAEAGGATGLVTTARSADPFGWKALRGSMGSALRLPVTSHHDTVAALEGARRRGCRIVVSVPRGGLMFDEACLDGATAIVVGGEGAGLASSIVAAADQRVTIPMAPPVESLNTAVSAALIVYEARRQRVAAGARQHVIQV